MKRERLVSPRKVAIHPVKFILQQTVGEEAEGGTSTSAGSGGS
jgi:hypothetical protein